MKSSTGKGKLSRGFFLSLFADMFLIKGFIQRIMKHFAIPSNIST